MYRMRGKGYTSVVSCLGQESEVICQLSETDVR
jgi:hypothetical protein